VKQIALALALFFISVSAVAAERETVCAKYQSEGGWSKNYKVEATIIRGTELNQATRSFEYNGLSTYVVIFWDKDQASIIEMSWPHLSPIGQEGKTKEE
jgi:hypothetical protein